MAKSVLPFLLLNKIKINKKILVALINIYFVFYRLMIYNKNMKSYDVCIIGGGASGTVASILLARAGLNVCVVDKFDKPAKKLLATGNGRCNITNVNMGSKFYNQNIDSFLLQFGYQDTINLFNSFGLDIYADAEGRCYPISNSAKSVQAVLINQMQKYCVEFFANTEVLNVEQDKNGYKVLCNTNNIFCNHIIFACGINEFSKKILKRFNIKVNQIVPSLVALKTKQKTKIIDGVRVSNVFVKANCGNDYMEESGEILFKGKSGICIFNISSIFAKNKCFNGKISINLLKNYSKSQIIKMITAKLNIFKSMQTLLESIVEPKLAKYVLSQIELQEDMITEHITAQQIEMIADKITNMQFDIVDCYDNNQVYSGGVDLQSLTNTLQCKQHNNMYFCGEICDVDGVCGGYNLQWAWTSANLVSKDIIKHVK